MKPSILLACLVAPVSAAGVLPAAAQDPAQARLEQGRALAAAGKPEEALAAFRAAAALHRGDVEISREYQNALVRLGRREEALREYRALAEAYPDEATWHYLLGRLLDGDALEKEFREALNRSPSFFWAHFGLGQYYLDRGRAGEAIPHLEKSRELRPDLLETHDALAQAHYFGGQFQQAEAVWMGAAKRFPDAPSPRLGLGVMYKTIGQADRSVLPRAIEELESVVRKWPQAWEAYEPLIQACYAAGEPAKAEAHRGKARQVGGKLQKAELVVDVVDLGTRVLIVREQLHAGGGRPWVRMTSVSKGRGSQEESPAASVFPAGKEGVELYRVDPAKPDDRGTLIGRYDAAPPHATLVERVKHALAP